MKRKLEQNEVLLVSRHSIFNKFCRICRQQPLFPVSINTNSKNKYDIHLKCIIKMSTFLVQLQAHACISLLNP
jgi:hypothetical protein